MNKILSFLFLFLLLIIYIYSITFVFIPISAKILTELVCCIYCLKYIFNKNYKLKNEYKSLLIALFIIIIWDIIISALNMGNEFYLAKRMIPIIGSIFFAHCIYILSSKITNQRDCFLKILVLVILIESIISLLIKLFPPLLDFIASFLVFDFENETIYNNLIEKGRFHGIGIAMFFGVLPSCALGLMISMYLFIRDNSKLMKLFWLFTWIFIFSISFLTARYTVFLGLTSVLYYVFLTNNKNFYSNIFILLLILLLGYVAYLIVISYVDNSLINWAFGWVSGDNKDDNTVYYLTNWWLNVKFSFKTFFIGDARYIGDNGIGYYMGVDIGIIRQIFYGGFIGLLLNLYAHFKILKMSFINDSKKDYKSMLLFLMICYIVILTKGDSNMMSLFILFLIIKTNGVFRSCC